MTVTHANSWDAAKLLREMSEEEKARVKEAIVVRKLACEVTGRKYNKKLLSFVEGRLNNAAMLKVTP